MPTSSIFAELKFTTEEDVKKLVDALEQTVNDTTPPVKVNYKMLTKNEVRELFAKTRGESNMEIKTQGHIFELFTYGDNAHSVISKNEDDYYGRFTYTDEFDPQEIKIIYDALVALGWL